jgi:putative phage-type endonuclease
MTTATMRKVTPTAYQVLRADAPRDEWLAARRRGVGSSDIAKIIGVADRQQAVHVWHDKRRTLASNEDDAGEAALWGNLHEKTVADEWCRRNRSVIRRVGLVENENDPWMMCTLDRLVRECPLDRERKAACALEVKTRSAFKAHRWHKSTPDDVLAQATWQRMVTGLDHIHVAALIGGNDYRQTVVRGDKEIEEFLYTGGHKFWHINILRGVQPAWDYDVDHPEDLLDLDRRLHGVERVGELDVDGIGDVMEYAELSKVAGDAERNRKRASARLMELADGNRFVTFSNELAYEIAPRAKTRVDLERLAEKYPQAYADPDVVSETTFTAIQIAKAYRRGKS